MYTVYITDCNNNKVSYCKQITHLHLCLQKIVATARDVVDLIKFFVTSNLFMLNLVSLLLHMLCACI